MTTAINPTDDRSADVARTFRSERLEERYRADGYVVTPLLSPGEVEQILSIYWTQIAQREDSGLVVDYVRTDRRAMAAVRELTEPILERHLAELFDDHRAIFRTFVVKHPGHGSEMYLHEDRSWVDERLFRSGTLWIPMVDVGTDLSNGRLEVIPKSHLLATTWSGSRTPDLIRPYEAWLRERLIPLDVRAGHAVYYDSRTLHASPPNLTDHARVALVYGIAPRRARLLHVVATSPSHRVIYEVDEDFFIRHGPRTPEDAMPDGYRVLEQFDETSTLDAHHLASVLGGEVPLPSPVVPSRIAIPRDVNWTSATADGTTQVSRAPQFEPVPVPPRWLRVIDGEVRWSRSTTSVPHASVRRRMTLRPGSCAQIRLEAGEPLEATVLRATRTGAGLVYEDSAVNPTQGDVFRLGSGTTLMFNDGPGDMELSFSEPLRLRVRLRARLSAMVQLIRR